MQRGAEKDEGINFARVVPPYDNAICTKLEKPGPITRASSLPPCTYPKVVEHARRTSTRAVLKSALVILNRYPNTTGPLNVSALATATGFHRRTVARALAFGIRFKIIERVVPTSPCALGTPHHLGRPVRYKSLWKLTTSKRAPSLKKSYKVQALASTKTGLDPSKNLRSAAMVKVRRETTSLGQPRLTSAYGKYVWSKAATVAGISLLVHTASTMIDDRTKTLPLRDAFAVVVQNINLACRSLDATEHYLAQLKREALPDDIDDLFQKPTLANIDNYVETHHSLTPEHTHTQLRPHLKLKGALPSTIDESPLFVSNQKESKPEGSDGKVRVTDPECAGCESGFSSVPDGLLQRWRTLIRGLTEDDVDRDVRPRRTPDDDSTRPRAGPRGRHGGTVPRPFGPRRAAIVDDGLARRRRQARRRVRLTGCSDAHGGLTVLAAQRRDTRTLTTDADR